MTTKSQSPVNIRPAEPGDVPAIAELVAPYVAAQILLPRSHQELAKLAEHGFVAEADGRIVGFAAIEIYSRKLAEIQSLAVAEAYQGRGIGKALIGRCVQHARQCGIHELMAITALEKPFTDCGFHYSLPDQKRALFIHPQTERPGSDNQAP